MSKALKAVQGFLLSLKLARFYLELLLILMIEGKSTFESLKEFLRIKVLKVDGDKRLSRKTVDNKQFFESLVSDKKQYSESKYKDTAIRLIFENADINDCEKASIGVVALVFSGFSGKQKVFLSRLIVVIAVMLAMRTFGCIIDELLAVIVWIIKYIVNNLDKLQLITIGFEISNYRDVLLLLLLYIAIPLLVVVVIGFIIYNKINGKTG